MKTTFHGERNSSTHGSVLSAAQQLQTPPPEDGYFPDVPFRNNGTVGGKPGFEIDAWIELWDYAGGASFRAFIANDGKEKTLFVFFDLEGVMGRDLKKALMALIDLADGPLQCDHVVTCIDRALPIDEAVEFTKSLQWVGFELTTFDHWAGDLDVTSNKWVMMGLEM